MIRQGKVTSSELVELFIAQIEKVNQHTNAMVRSRFEEARKEAKEKDRQLQAKQGQFGPLFGVPISIKECFAVEGMPQTGGLKSREAYRAIQSAPVVSRLLEAGAVILGVTNLSELCMWMESFNTVYGLTSTPYDLARTSGGSSGGEAVLAATCGAALGLGSDIGGSIRMPAFFCGVFGHKPSGGLIPGTGQFPIAEGRGLFYLTTGPLAKRASDLWPAIQLLAGPDGQDQACQPYSLGDPASIHISTLPVASIRRLPHPLLAVAPPLLRIQQEVELALERAGCSVVGPIFFASWPRMLVWIQNLPSSTPSSPINPPPGLAYATDIWSACLGSVGGKTFYQLLADGQSLSLWPELAKHLLGRASEFTLPALGLAVLEEFTKLFETRNASMVKLRDELEADMDALIGPGILLFPSHTQQAPRHYTSIFKSGNPRHQANFLTPQPINWTYTAIFNVLGYPATQVPLGLSPDGLPLGIQVVARRGNDHLTVAVALWLEKQFGGWAPPTGLSLAD